MPQKSNWGDKIAIKYMIIEERRKLEFELEGLRIDLGALRNTYINKREKIEKRINELIDKIYIDNPPKFIKK